MDGPVDDDNSKPLWRGWFGRCRWWRRHPYSPWITGYRHTWRVCVACGTTEVIGHGERR